MNIPNKVYLEIIPNSNSKEVFKDVLKTKRSFEDDVEYTRTDAFIEKACEFLYNYNKNQVLKHGAKATLGCGEYTINVEDFRNYMKGE